MKSGDFHAPRFWFGLHPSGIPLRHGKRPIEQIGHMRDDLRRSASSLAQLKISKSGRRITLDFGPAIGDRRKCVAEKGARRIFQCQSGSSLSVST